MTMGDRIVVMKDGVIQQVAPPQELYDKPANLFVAGFIGSPTMNFLRGRLSADARVFDGGTFTLSLPDPLAAAAKDYGGKEMVLGIRPESIHANPEFVSAYDGPRIPARIEVVEPLGSEIYLYLTSGENQITARVEPHLRFHSGENLTLAVDADKVHLFDAESEMAIR